MELCNVNDPNETTAKHQEILQITWLVPQSANAQIVGIIVVELKAKQCN